MKERPLLFSDDMVRAILSGRKRQTRRILNRVHSFGKVREFGQSSTPGYDWHFRCRRGLWHDLSHEELLACCPYGVPGDQLWVREYWSPDHADFYPHHPIVYRASYPIDVENGVVYSPEQRQSFSFKWRPSIHMPREHSRIDLRVESVRVERIQEISDSDAVAEGVDVSVESPMAMHEAATASSYGMSMQRFQFACLWDRINMNRGFGWHANPWVWVVKFSVRGSS